MRKFLIAIAIAAAAALVGRPAFASPAMPRPLERKIADADIVVVAKLVTRPTHAGDPYDVEIESALKGKATGRIRVSAAYFFTGCVPPPSDAPRPSALEAKADRVLLFLDEATDGTRASRDPILLGADNSASAWFYDTRDAALAPAAVRSIIAIDAETDAARGAELWAAGLEGDNLLLVTALAHRASFVADGGDGAKWELGEALASRAKEQFAAGRGRILSALARRTEPGDRVLQLLSLRLFASVAPHLGDAPAESEAMARAVRAAQSAATRDLSDDVVRAAFDLLCAADDARVADRVIADLAAADARAAADLGRGAARVVARHPSTLKSFAAAALPLLDDKARHAVGAAFVGALAGKKFETDAALRDWVAQSAK